MVSVTIHHCTLRVLRRGGWSWGPDPQRLVDNAVPALLRLIARHLGERLPETDEDVVIASPIEVRVPVRCSDLLLIHGDDEADVSEVVPLAVQRVLFPALDDALARVTSSRLDGTAGSSARARRTTAHGDWRGEQLAADEDSPEHPRYGDVAAVVGGKDGSLAGRIECETLLRVLREWRNSGELVAILRGFALVALEAWHDALLGPSRARASSSSATRDERIESAAWATLPTDLRRTRTVFGRTSGSSSSSPGQPGAELESERVEGLLRSLASRLGSSATSRKEILVRRIAIATEISARLRIAPSAPECLESLERFFPLLTQATFEGRAESPGRPTANASPRAESASLTAGACSSSEIGAERDAGAANHRGTPEKTTTTVQDAAAATTAEVGLDHGSTVDGRFEPSATATGPIGSDRPSVTERDPGEDSTKETQRAAAAGRDAGVSAKGAVAAATTAEAGRNDAPTIQGRSEPSATAMEPIGSDRPSVTERDPGGDSTKKTQRAAEGAAAAATTPEAGRNDAPTIQGRSEPSATATGPIGSERPPVTERDPGGDSTKKRQRAAATSRDAGVSAGERAVTDDGDARNLARHRTAGRPHPRSSPDSSFVPGTSSGSSFVPGLVPGSSAVTNSHAVPARESFRRSATGSEVQVASVLPFLLLGPLSRIGYLETLAASLEAAQMSREVPLFAAALAYKVLGPAERGWRRSPGARRGAAALAGLEAEVEESALVGFSRLVADFLSPADTVLARSLIQGRSLEQPLLLYRDPDGGGYLLVEVEGFFPMAWSHDLDGLHSTIAQCGTAVLLIPDRSAEPKFLQELEARSLRFVTAAPPTQGEDWRALRRPPRDRWWSNDRGAPESRLIRAARELSAAGERMENLWRELVVQRPSIPLARESSVERSVTLAAAVALGCISWELWREREPVDPLLALERFGNLEARVRFRDDCVDVRIPLGRRFQDLEEHGLLAEVKGVPWLNGRVLRFQRG